mmetsp:Transcript_7009/g.8004  ORF Transcript_7009/g.8004 Transcript_7009/m.8004 type:complete len:411 (-) Transcript_7009:347-1579(-)|eukprot:CAMPEP_0197847902 /NCGR_PEP_ID=MMETSP1438-20131217/7434_1 /TAXON_ID=1461541 /ORGANISM="Pterosperma sp., Strain CCMP1384" /LENGTH=410 /DNA_ID=CAMNT_0043459969 /DNA_START=146 /DNA_END=1378 /DNA_ORIENTATION=-
MADQIKRSSELKKVKFGNSDMMVTECCVGSMMWGSFNGEEQMSYDQMDKAIELGCNFFDTAELYPVAFNYGKTTEIWMGNWLEKRVAEGKVDRSKIYLATKCNMMGIGSPLEARADGSKVGPHSYDEEVLTASCKASIERLKCDYIDLYQLHMPSRDVPIFGPGFFAPEGQHRPFPFADKGTPEMFEKQVLAVKKLLDEGLIKHWGLSNENNYGITMFCMTCDKLGVPRPVSCQNDYSLVDRLYETDGAEAAHRFGVVGLPYGALAGGVLTGKYIDKKYQDPDRPIKDCRHIAQPEFQPRYAWPGAMVATEKYVKLAEKYGLTPTEMALVWSRDRFFNGSIITGTTTVRQVEECVNAFKIEKLPEELMVEIDTINEEFRSPIIYYGIKEVARTAPWKEDTWGRVKPEMLA